MKSRIFLLGAFALSACQVNIEEGDDNSDANEQTTAATSAPKPVPVPTLRFADVAETGSAPFDPGPILHAQVALDRAGFSSGVNDGKDGQNFQTALRGFQKAQGLKVTGSPDAATLGALDRILGGPPTRLVRIPPAFAKGPFTPDLPKEAGDQAKLPALNYRDLMEALAERFHTKPETLAALNPQGKLGANQVIRVPNVPDIDAPSLAPDTRGWNATLERLAVAATQPEAARVVVDKSDGVLRAFDAEDRLIAQFPATMGSKHDPLPIGTWKIQGVSRNPDFHYNPDLFWDAAAGEKAAVLKPGPNGPVGVVWIDISKPHYGIHGTSEPGVIGRAESHGCIRLTNWDAARLAQMVKPGVPAIFQE